MASSLWKFVIKRVKRHKLTGFLFSCFIFPSCTHVFYQPSSIIYSTPDQQQIKFENHLIKTLNGIQLHAWLLKSQKEKKAKNLVLFFHGNAQNLSSHYLSLAWLTQYSYDVLIVDYQGYGQSQGEANQKNLYHDSLNALSYAYHLKIKNKYKNLILYAQSLGASIALRALQDSSVKKDVDLVVIDSGFRSYKKMAFKKLAHFWPTFLFSPLGFLLVSNKYAADSELKHMTLPTLVIHAEDDPVVYSSLGKEVFEKIPSTHKWFWQLQGESHISVFHGPYEKYRREFLLKVNNLKMGSCSDHANCKEMSE